MISIEDFAKLNLRTATIKEVRDHPEADRLYLITVDLGGEERTLVAGIKQSYSIEELTGRQVVVVENIQPAKIRGVESRGMILAAQDGDRIVIVGPERPVSPGSPVR